MRKNVRGEHGHDHLIRAEFLTAQQAHDQSHGNERLRFFPSAEKKLPTKAFIRCDWKIQGPIATSLSTLALKNSSKRLGTDNGGETKAGQSVYPLSLTWGISPLALAGQDKLISYRRPSVLDHVVEHCAVRRGVRVHRGTSVDLSNRDTRRVGGRVQNGQPKVGGGCYSSTTSIGIAALIVRVLLYI